MQRLTVSRSRIAPIARPIPATMTIHVSLSNPFTSIYDALAGYAGAASDQKKHEPSDQRVLHMSTYSQSPYRSVSKL